MLLIRREAAADGLGGAEQEISSCEKIPAVWWVSGLIASTALCTAILSPLFDLPVGVVDPSNFVSPNAFSKEPEGLSSCSEGAQCR